MIPKISLAIRSVFAILTLGLVAAFTYLAITGYISDSEIWSVSLAKNIAGEWKHPWFITRPIFHFTLAIAESFFSSAIKIFYAAKIVSLLNGLAILFFTYRLTKALVSREIAIRAIIPLAALILLLANTGFLNQGYRIRSDLFACGLILLALERSLRKREAGLDSLQFKDGIFWLIPIFCTPKALFQIVPALLFVRPKTAIKIGVAFTLAFFILFYLVYPQAIYYFLDTFFTSANTSALATPDRFIYLNRIVNNNRLFVFFFFGRLITLSARISLDLFRTAAEKEKHLDFLLFLLASLLISLLVPEKVPFFLASYLPLICVFCALALEDFWLLIQTITTSRRSAYEIAFLGCLLFSFGIFGYNASKEFQLFRDINNSTAEFQAIRILEEYLSKYPKASYYDVVGLVPKRATSRAFIGPNDKIANSSAMFFIQTQMPQLIFYVGKLASLEPEISKLLKAKYASLGDGIFSRWTMLPTPLKPSETKALKSIQEKEFQSVGAGEQSKFSILVSGLEKEPKRMEISPNDYSQLAKKLGKRATILAITPFASTPPLPMILPNLIHFDWGDDEEAARQNRPGLPIAAEMVRSWLGLEQDEMPVKK